LKHLRQWLGSVAFTAILFGSVAVYGLIVLLAAPLGYERVYALVTVWVDWILTLLERLCGLGFHVEGLEHLPDRNAVLLLKHSSAWETIAQIKIFPRQTWVLKRELLWAPVLGWVLVLLKPIAINRSAGRTAVEQVLQQGQQRLEEGLWIVIFPEGTRVPAGQSRRYGISGALLANAAGRPVVPVAHNAGEFWPRRGLLKRSGTIRVVIGKPISTVGRDAREVTEDARRWIEARLSEMAPATER
jgi:1-acyl-sn-glycerol-3-phosphate acyltransferase